MKTKSLVQILLLVTFAAASASCSALRGARGSEPSPPHGHQDLVDALRADGYVVESLGPISQPFFQPEGQLLSVDGHEVQVFEYSSEEYALVAAESVSPDGSSVGTTMVSWIGPPHFFRSGTLIVLYVGDDATALRALQTVLGPQIAGR